LTIIRAPRPNRDFTIVSNDLARDQSLSYRARGLLLAILSRPDNWHTTSQQLAREGKEGRDAVRTALDELEQAGYVAQWKRQDQHGHWSQGRKVFDKPQVTEAWKTDAGSTDAGLSGASIRTVTYDREEENNLGQPPVDRFSEWWSLYPKKVGKLGATKAWKKALKVASAAAIIAATEAFARECLGTDQQFIPHPATWLNAGRWDDEPVSATSEPGPGPAPAQPTRTCSECGVFYTGGPCMYRSATCPKVPVAAGLFA
jgi:hypothetical protein